MPARLDLRLYLVTDPAGCMGRDLAWVVAEALAGGVTMVQLREKQATTREFLERAWRIKPICDAAGAPLIINDRVDVALAVGAAGVHLGRQDMPYADARRLLGPRAIIGLTVHDMAELEEAKATDADYFGLGPVFPTRTKPDAPAPWDMDEYARASVLAGRPVVAIGGIGPHNARIVLAAGAHGLAVSSAICSADSPKWAAMELAALHARLWPS
ncbi:thiamine phosphate synthase [Desulfocurvibacter africanus]|uniref:thiamine phosphate synthase n=1 Tax=Desulfocurvibacter africanus TaxID=873 RepID=UPI0004028632|nr:thiamine phosphate synthase [Desulfocurvibacter africanus]